MSSQAHREAIAPLRRGDWQAAHALVQTLEDALACHLHGIVHRLEGDLGNARYWYRRARVSFAAQDDVAAELTRIETALADSVASPALRGGRGDDD